MNYSKLYKFASRFESLAKKAASPSPPSSSGSDFATPSADHGNVKPELLNLIITTFNQINKSYLVSPFYTYSLYQDPNTGDITMNVTPMAPSAMTGISSTAMAKLKQTLESKIPQLKVVKSL